MKKAKKPSLEILREKTLEVIPWLIHGFSTRLGGSSKLYGGNALNLGFTAQDSPEAVERNRNALIMELTREIPGQARGRSRPATLVTVKQIHSDRIHAVDQASAGSLATPGAGRGTGLRFGAGPSLGADPRSGDGLITNVPGVLLGIETADCLPLLLVDTKKKAVGALHAGWRGTLARIAQKGVGTMQKEYGCEPKDIRVAIGPGIHQCCYAVGVEMRSQFEAQFAYAGELFDEVYESDSVRSKCPMLFLSSRPPGHSDLGPRIHLDLVEANRRQLLDAGVRRSNIAISPWCTSCHTELLFSYRAEQGNTGRMMAAIGIRG